MHHIWLCENEWKFIFNENENLGDWDRVASRKTRSFPLVLNMRFAMC